MSGHSPENFDDFAAVRWADAELQETRIDYDSVSLTIRDSSSLVLEVVGLGYIGYRMIGCWDEIVIARAELLEKHELLSQSIETIRSRYSGTPPDTGSKYRNAGDWRVLVIHFVDGATLEVVLGGLILKRQ
jgi:hypothetical protein